MKRSGKGDAKTWIFSNSIPWWMPLQHLLPLLCPERHQFPDSSDKAFFRMRQVAACIDGLFPEEAGTSWLLGQFGQRHYWKEADLWAYRLPVPLDLICGWYIPADGGNNPGWYTAGWHRRSDTQDDRKMQIYFYRSISPLLPWMCQRGYRKVWWNLLAQTAADARSEILPKASLWHQKQQCFFWKYEG